MSDSADEACRAALTAMTGEGAFIDWLIERERSQGADPFGLDPIDRAVIRLWTSPHPWHRFINRDPALKLGPTFDAALEPVRNRLAEAVRKLPRYSGLCFRGVRLELPSPAAAIGRGDVSKFLELYKAGRRFAWQRFSSATTNPDRAFPGDILFTIVSVTGRRLQGYAADDTEQEVLFLPGSAFRVIDCEVVGPGKALSIQLAELVPDSSSLEPNHPRGQKP